MTDAQAQRLREYRDLVTDPARKGIKVYWFDGDDIAFLLSLLDEKDQKLAAQKAENTRLREALVNISDMPVIDWCSDECTKWQPSNIAAQALRRGGSHA